MTKETRLSGEERQKRLTALDYERTMLRRTAMALASGIIENPLTVSVFLESFLIHARLLIAFLFGPPVKDDITPGDWLDPREWGNICGKKSELLSDTYEDTNKYLAHLTATRLAREKNWDPLAIQREIDALLGKFLQQMQGISDEDRD